MTTIKIEGMSCDHCVMAVTRVLSGIDGITNVKVDLKKGRATFDETHPVDMKAITEAIYDAGYRVVSE
jgi:copper chaperone